MKIIDQRRRIPIAPFFYKDGNGNAKITLNGESTNTTWIEKCLISLKNLFHISRR